MLPPHASHVDASTRLVAQNGFHLGVAIIGSASAAAEKAATEGNGQHCTNEPHCPLGQSDLMAYPPPDIGTVVPISALH
jgi:hypothetical protein